MNTYINIVIVKHNYNYAYIEKNK